MSYGNIRQRTHEAATPPADEAGCSASGCPCRGSVSLDNGGRFLCSAHAFSFPDQWPRITEKLREHDWLIAFTDDIAKLNREHRDWRGFAVQFWSTEDAYCNPHERESAQAYGLRMRGELLYRCGLGKRPAPRLPQQIKRRGNAADLATQKVAA